MTGQPTRPELAALRVADPPERWSDLGFAVDRSTVSFAGVSIELGADGEGIVGWRLRGVGVAGTIDGLVTDVVDAPAAEPGAHPNGAVGIDHVVVVTPRFTRT